MAGRSLEEIRSTMEVNRAQLELSVVRLRGEVAELTDWRAQVRRHRPEAIAVAALAGFALGLMYLPGASRRRRRR